MKIPATVVTGFLGAGKTSLLRHLVSDARGRRLALIINEFGEMGADREILLGCGIPACREEDIVELANGCICCTVADEFLPTIERLIDRAEPPEHIVIETSGLALPKPLIKAFTWPEVRSRASVDGVIAVIDAKAVADGRFAADPGAVDAQRRADPALDHASPLEELFADQLAAADLVVLNKRDLVEPEALARVERTIASGLRPGVTVVRASHGRLPAHALLGLGAGAEDDLANRPSHHDGATDEHGHDEFESVSLPLGPVADIPGLARRIEGLAARHGVLRVKGFLEVPGRSLRLVLQGVGSRVQHYFDRPWRADEPRGGTLVVIGLKGLDRGAIEAALVG